jgi:hypothetical protein
VKKLLIGILLLAGSSTTAESVRRHARASARTVSPEKKMTIWSTITGSFCYMTWELAQVLRQPASAYLMATNRLYFRTSLASTAMCGSVALSFFAKTVVKMSPDQRLELQRTIELLER